MKSVIQTEIPKTQNGIYGKWIPEENKNEFTPYPDDFFYSDRSFVGCKIEIEFDKNDIISRTLYGSTHQPLDKIIRDTIYNKQRELSDKIHGILLSYKIESKVLTDNELKVLVEVTQCEADCG